MSEASDNGRSLTAAPQAAPSRHTLWLLATLFACAVAQGVRSIRMEQPSGMDLVLPLMFVVALGWWAVVDARRRGHPIPFLSRPWFFILGSVVVPCYIVWSRRWMGVLWLILIPILWIVVATAVVVVGRILLLGGA